MQRTISAQHRNHDEVWYSTSDSAWTLEDAARIAKSLTAFLRAESTLDTIRLQVHIGTAHNNRIAGVEVRGPNLFKLMDCSLATYTGVKDTIDRIEGTVMKVAETLPKHRLQKARK